MENWKVANVKTTNGTERKKEKEDRIRNRKGRENDVRRGKKERRGKELTEHRER